MLCGFLTDVIEKDSSQVVYVQTLYEVFCMVIKEVKDDDRLRIIVENQFTPVAQKVIEAQVQEHFTYVFQVLSVLVSCSKACTEFYLACLVMLLSGNGIFVKDLQAAVPAFGAFIRAMLRKHPQVFLSQKN